MRGGHNKKSLAKGWCDGCAVVDVAVDVGSGCGDSAVVVVVQLA